MSLNFLQVHNSAGKAISKTGIFIGDVSGHGIPAAMFSSMAKLVLSSTAAHYDKPGEFLKHIQASNKFMKNQLSIFKKTDALVHKFLIDKRELGIL